MIFFFKSKCTNVTKSYISANVATHKDSMKYYRIKKSDAVQLELKQLVNELIDGKCVGNEH